MFANQKKCKNCGRAIKEIDGTWVHYWWRDDPEDDCRRVMSGSRECLFIGRPERGPGFAEPPGEKVGL